MKKILIINGHPSENSFCQAIAAAYVNGAKESGWQINCLHVRDLDFDLILRDKYIKMEVPMEPDVLKAQKLISISTHIVFISPVWWGSVTALLKGFIDRVFSKGFAYNFKKGSVFPEQLLKGKTASVIYTQGASSLISFFIGDPMWKMMKTHFLMFCGFGNIKRYRITNSKKLSPIQGKNILQDITTLAKSGRL